MKKRWIIILGLGILLTGCGSKAKESQQKTKVSSEQTSSTKISSEPASQTTSASLGVADSETTQASTQKAKINLSADKKQEINDQFLLWAIEQAKVGNMAVTSRYFDHGAAGRGDWYANTPDGEVQVQDNGYPGAGSYDIHSIGGCVFYTAADGTIGLDEKAEQASTAESYYINLDPSKPVHIYLLGDNDQVYEYIFIPQKDGYANVFGELEDNGTHGQYGPKNSFSISNDKAAKEKLNELIGNQ